MANLQRFRNNATAVLSGALSQGGTTAVLSAGMGNRFDAPTNGDYFLLTLYEKDDGGNEVNVEVVKVTARVGDTLTIVRDVENLTGQVGGFSYPSSATRTVFLALRWTAAGAAGMLQAGQNLADLGSVSAARGNLGLGGAAIADIGTSAGTVAAGNHTHTSAAITDLTALGISLATASSAAAARTAIGAGTSSLVLGTLSGQAATSSGSTGTSSNAAREDHTHPVGVGYVPMVISTNTAAATNRLYVITAALTLTLPASPSVGATLQVVNLATSPVVAANGANIMSSASDLTVDMTPATFTLTYVDATRGWVIQ